ncbi:hypothetical protein [Chamaesiphon sp. GL140_3_metabinner_50]|nr:hypothetical protein [Chamaesiphon sp. GL140_3_metabinner_50]
MLDNRSAAPGASPTVSIDLKHLLSIEHNSMGDRQFTGDRSV